MLQVPVPALDAHVRARTAHYDTDYLSDDPRLVHAHVTALAPFPPERATYIRQVTAGVAPFDFTLSRIDTFPNGIVHLVPDPAAPFATLTDRLCAAFGDLLPYDGQFQTVRPHLTLDALSDDVTEDGVRDSLADLLPVRGRAERLDLVWYEPRRCRLLATWPLGVG